MNKYYGDYLDGDAFKVGVFIRPYRKKAIRGFGKYSQLNWFWINDTFRYKG